MTENRESDHVRETRAVLHKPVDLSNFAERKEEIGQELLTAATSTGFWNVVGHGIPQVRALPQAH